MKKRFKILALAVSIAAVLVLSVGAVALAAGPGGGAGKGACVGTGGGQAVCSDAVTKLLNMTAEEVQALRQQGQSLVQIAATKGVTEAQLVAAIMAEKTAEVQTRVTAGTLTQAQADLMLQQMEQNTIRAVNRTTVGRPEWAGSGQGGGACGAACQAQGGASNGESGLGTGPGGMHKWGQS